MTRSSPGQASADYVAIVAVVAVPLVTATTAALAVPGVSERISTTVRTGLCIVGGDVCRSVDAAAAGLEPCLTSERSKRQDTTLDVAVLRLGGHGEWQIALQSDGSAVVARLEEHEGGGTAGVGVTFSPAKIDASARVVLTAGYRSGRAWRFADARQAGAFLDGAMHDDKVKDGRAPDIEWDGVAGSADADASAALAGLTSAGIQASTDGVLGLRREGARRTLTVDLRTEGPALALDLPGFPASPDARAGVVADVTWEHGRATSLVIRTAAAKDERLEEISVALDLRDAAHRALAERLLVPGGTRDELRAIAARAAEHGVVERSVYSTSERRRGLNVAGRLGVSIGLSHERVEAERRLVDAVAWAHGRPPVRRLDCLGV